MRWITLISVLKTEMTSFTYRLFWCRCVERTPLLLPYSEVSCPRLLLTLLLFPTSVFHSHWTQLNPWVSKFLVGIFCFKESGSSWCEVTALFEFMFMYASLSELWRTQTTVWLSYGIVFYGAQYKARLVLQFGACGTCRPSGVWEAFSLLLKSKIKSVFVCSTQIEKAFQKRDCWACPASTWLHYECVSVKTHILKDYYFGLMVGCFPQSVYCL